MRTSDSSSLFPEREQILAALGRRVSRMVRSGVAVLDTPERAARRPLAAPGRRFHPIDPFPGIKEKFDSMVDWTMLDLRQVFSLTDFLRNHKEMVARVTESHKPVVLTIKGKPALVLQDAEGYQALIDRLEAAEGKGEAS